MRFGARTKDSKSAEIKVKQVRRRIDSPQRTVNIEIVAFVRLHKTTAQYDLEHVAALAMFNSLANVFFMLFVGERAGCFANMMKFVFCHKRFLNRLFNRFNVRLFAVGSKFADAHRVIEMIERDDILIKNVNHIGSIVLHLCLVFYGNVFQVTNGIERRVAEQSQIFVVVYIEFVQKFIDNIRRKIVCIDWMLVQTAVGIDAFTQTVLYGNVGDWANADIRAAVFRTVVIGTFH